MRTQFIRMLAVSAMVALLSGQSLMATTSTQQSKSKSKTATKKAPTKPPAKSKRTRNRPTKWMPGVTPGREAAVFTFVRVNHPELESVLQLLKKKNVREYQRAIRDLFRVSERLAAFQERAQEEKYRLELKIWQAQSRAQLLAARIKSSPEAKQQQLVTALRRELDTQIELRLKSLKRDRDRQAERLKKLDAQIARIKAAQDKTVSRQVRLLTAKKPTKKTIRNSNGRLVGKDSAKNKSSKTKNTSKPTSNVVNE